MFFINETKIRRFWPIAFKNDGQGPSIERVEGVFYCNGWVIGIVNEVSKSLINNTPSCIFIKYGTYSGSSLVIDKLKKLA